jgi:putative protein kinase ArgK-like GTPase of G3E family
MTYLEALKITHKIQRTQLRIAQMLDLHELKKSGEEDMPISPAVATLITGFDDATNAVADRIQKLVNASGLTPEEVAAFQVEIERLKTLGQDPSNPIPPEPPAPPA